MRKLEKLVIEYVGYKDPDSMDEVEMEILGLEAAIQGAKHRIAVLRQGVQLNKLMQSSVGENDVKNIVTPKTPDNKDK